jgi:hypothetical protein
MQLSEATGIYQPSLKIIAFVEVAGFEAVPTNLFLEAGIIGHYRELPLSKKSSHY